MADEKPKPKPKPAAPSGGAPKPAAQYPRVARTFQPAEDGAEESLPGQRTPMPWAAGAPAFAQTTGDATPWGQQLRPTPPPSPVAQGGGMPPGVPQAPGRPDWQALAARFGSQMPGQAPQRVVPSTNPVLGRLGGGAGQLASGIRDRVQQAAHALAARRQRGPAGPGGMP